MLKKAIVGFRGISIFLLCLLFSPRAVSADVFPWVSFDAKSQIRYTEDSRAALDVQIEWIKKAKHEVNLVTFDLRPDKEVTYPLLTALRNAADRGVAVRILTTNFTQLAFDFGRQIPQYLVDPPTRRPIDFVVFGSPRLEDQGWRKLDLIHTKLLIVDRKNLMTTGQGYGADYLRWMDTNFFIKGPLVGQALQVFNSTWMTLRGLGVEPFRLRSYSPTKSEVKFTAQALSDASLSSSHEILQWADQGIMNAGRETSRARWLHFNFVEQLSSACPNPELCSMDQRLKLLNDPVVDAMADRIQHAHSVRISTLFTLFHPRVKKALIEAAQRGAQVTILANSKLPPLQSLPFSPPNAVWPLEVADWDDLISAGAKVYSFEPDAAKHWVYTHRKLAVIDQSVFLGSHNFSIPSSTYNEEADLELEDESFAGTMSALFDSSLSTHGKSLPKDEVHASRQALTTRIFSELFLPLLPAL